MDEYSHGRSYNSLDTKSADIVVNTIITKPFAPATRLQIL